MLFFVWGYILRIHYSRDDKNYDNLGIWFWEDVKHASVGWPDGATKPSGCDDFGLFFDVELNEAPSKVSFLILNIKEGKQIEPNNTIYVGKNRDVFVRSGDANVYDTKELRLKASLRQTLIVKSNVVRVYFNTMVDLNAEVLAKTLRIEGGNREQIKVVSVSMNVKRKLSADIKVEKELIDLLPLKVAFGDRQVIAGVDWHYIDKMYAYDGDDLGCNMEGEDAVIKIWSPLAEYINLCLYDKENQNKLILKKPMEKEKCGVWFVRITLNDIKDFSSKAISLIGYYYQFEIKNPGLSPLMALDPYAKSMAPVTVSPGGISAGSSNDYVGKAAIIDMNAITTPISRVKIDGYNRREDAVIYEVHVRDLTSDPFISDKLNGRFGSFRALISRLPYIKSLGVTHIELLPIMAWYWGDELAADKPEYIYKSKNCNYNWGYDPQNYFTPDGAYSENPSDAELRIRELRELVDAIHKAGMGVILDVVYTHMAANIFLNNIIPDYYFFKDKNGNFVGQFGNNVATSHKMAAKLIADSVKFWFREYGIDGMRWDMMGDAVAEVVQDCFKIAKKINPAVIFVGEAYKTTSVLKAEPGLRGKMADVDWLHKTADVGGYCDEIRDEIKSGFLHIGEGDPRFVSGGARKIAKLFSNLKGQPTGFKTSSPGSAVQYIEAHDNMTAFDSIAKATGLDPEIPEYYKELHKRLRLGLALVLTAQGTILFQAGLEYGRTKQWLSSDVPEQKYVKFTDKKGKDFVHPYFIRDSYNSSDAINKFDWIKATDSEKSPISVATMEYAKGLIALRRSTDAFRLGTIEAVDENVRLLQIPEIKKTDLVIAYSCHSVEKSETYFVIVNADSKPRKLTLSEDLTSSEILVDSECAGTKNVTAPKGFKLLAGSITVEPLTSVILKKRDK